MFPDDELNQDGLSGLFGRDFSSYGYGRYPYGTFRLNDSFLGGTTRQTRKEPTEAEKAELKAAFDELKKAIRESLENSLLTGDQKRGNMKSTQPNQSTGATNMGASTPINQGCFEATFTDLGDAIKEAAIFSPDFKDFLNNIERDNSDFAREYSSSRLTRRTFTQAIGDAIVAPPLMRERRFQVNLSRHKIEVFRAVESGDRATDFKKVAELFVSPDNTAVWVVRMFTADNNAIWRFKNV